jgi:tRNA nucleotidyltransferase (CCA-adding enzyme)
MANLASTIEKQLPPELVNFLHIAGEAAHSQGQSLYLVGGVVRDLLLGRTNLDLDLVVEGSAIDLAQRLVQIKPGKITTHPRFNTAKIQWAKWSIDLATARSETYAKPGALPMVKPGSLSDDLFRRDFTINTMAIHLNPSNYGKLIDLYRGEDDLEHKLLRVLHNKSFIDDATRIWRALRYEQRLNFQLEPTTLQLLQRDVAMLHTISGDRIRHELELILKEEFPEKTLSRAEELNVLKWLHPSLKGNHWLAKKFGQARELTSPNPPPLGLYLALLAYSLTEEDSEQLICHLRLPKSLAQTLRDTASIKPQLESLADPELAPSHIYHLLHGYSPLAITANSLATDSPTARRNIQLFLSKLRYVKSVLTGDDLKRMGIAPGPRIKEILNLLHDARLDRKVTSKRGEEDLVKGWVGERKQNKL